MDTFDLKPNAPEEYRGLFNPIQTNVEGIEISEHCRNWPVCRQVHDPARRQPHPGGSSPGQEYINTGTRPLASLEYPGYGAVVTKERPGSIDMPGFVGIPNTRQKAGFLGVKYAPLNTGRPRKRGGRSPSAGSPWPTA
ncbi:MAG: hypothetical protein Ct9H300mP1_12560 [Planctomycetaceae bacterium]|nr:MAG: hypothetical protein Ct9H300mP1_12560 [Planctomycetaceae bacterium]